MAAAAMFIELKSRGYRVHQAAFGSPEYFNHVIDLLQDKAIVPPDTRKTMGERLASYFRALRVRR
jgi:hypothetical protein